MSFAVVSRRDIWRGEEEPAAVQRGQEVRFILVERRYRVLSHRVSFVGVSRRDIWKQGDEPAVGQRVDKVQPSLYLSETHLAPAGSFPSFHAIFNA